MRFFADVRCETCKKEFYADLPIAHGIDFGCVLDKETGKVYSNNVFRRDEESWFSRILRQAYASKDAPNDASFQEKRNKEAAKQSLVVLNCLDNCYGHCLLKLLTAQYNIDNHKDKDLLIIVPKLLAWMVPEETERVIEVEMSLANGHLWMEKLSEYLTDVFRQYRKVYASQATHPHPKDFDITRFIPQCKPFSVSELGKASPPAITFITRNHSRLWVKTGLLYRLLPKRIWRKYEHVEVLRKVANHYQDLSIIKLFNNIKEYFPNVDFAVVGLGKKGNLPEEIKDMRCDKVDADKEIEWCKRYSRSNVVIGKIGSNMILPSALAGAVIDIVRVDSKIDGIVQEMMIGEKDPRMILWRYRILPLETSVSSVARITKSIISKNNQYYKNMIINSNHNAI